MADKEKQVPQVRFKGYTDTWEQRALSEILIVNSGRDYKHLNDGNVPVYGTGGYMLSVDESLSEVDAIGIGRKGTIDKPQLLPAPFWTVDTLFFLTPLHENDLLFQFALAQNIKWAKMDESTGVPSLSKVNIENVRIATPKFPEQTAIGEFFRTLDNTITLYQRKLDGLRELKRGYLQQMFPQAGERVPRMRFSGFSGEWQGRKLGEVSDVRDGTHDSPKYHQIGHPLVTSKNLTDAGLDMSNVSLISGEDFENINKRSKVDVGDIIFGMIGTIGNPVMIDRCDFAIKNVALIKNTGDAINGFLFQLLKSPIFERYIQSENAGNTQKFLGLNKIREFCFLAPDIPEQAAIGNFFRIFDEQIIDQHIKMKSLKQLKVAYLQKMFV